MDPEVIARLLARNTGNASVAALSRREREVLALMAEGRSNAAIAQRMVITEHAVAEHTASISSSNSTCSPPTTTTGTCSPCSPTWKAERPAHNLGPDGQDGGACLSTPARGSQ